MVPQDFMGGMNQTHCDNSKGEGTHRVLVNLQGSRQLRLEMLFGVVVHHLMFVLERVAVVTTRANTNKALLDDRSQKLSLRGSKLSEKMPSTF